MSRTFRLGFWIAVAALLVISRAAHLNVLWSDEDYHLAVAVQALHGKMLYRDIWYDKPPLSALLMMLIGAYPGWPLRLASVALELAGAAVAFRFARRLWGTREGYVAAAGFAFFHVFFFASTAIPMEPDTLMVLPHILAVYLAWTRRAAWAGFVAGLAFLLNTKGLFVLAACLLFYPAGWLALGAGFLVPCSAAAAWLVSQNAFGDYLDQVWRWGFLYAAHPLPERFSAPLLRLGTWVGFHAALVFGAVFACWKMQDLGLRWKLCLWLGSALIAALIGWRMPPRYLNQLFPPLLLLASFGTAAILARRGVWRWIVVVAVLVPLVRFAPRYAQLIVDDLRGTSHMWSDVSMDTESRVAGAVVNRIARPGDTIFVWGYRPNVVAYTRLPIAGQMWESQPVTTVPADRHLKLFDPLDPAWAARNQAKLVSTRPTIIVDGLSAYNPRLDIHTITSLERWLKQYCKVGDAIRGITIYRLCE